MHNTSFLSRFHLKIRGISNDELIAIPIPKDLKFEEVMNHLSYSIVGKWRVLVRDPILVAWGCPTPDQWWRHKELMLIDRTLWIQREDCECIEGITRIFEYLSKGE